MFYPMLSVSVNYNIPRATQAVLDAACSALADAADPECIDLGRLASGLEIARQVLAMQGSSDVQVDYTREMVTASEQLLQRLGWDSVKEFVVY